MGESSGSRWRRLEPTFPVPDAAKQLRRLGQQGLGCRRGRSQIAASAKLSFVATGQAFVATGQAIREEDPMKRVASLIALGTVLSFGSFTVAAVTAPPAMAAKHKGHPKPKAKAHKANHKTTSSSKAATTGPANCPTLTQAEGALGASYSNLAQTPTPGGGIVCEYIGGRSVVNACSNTSRTLVAAQGSG